MTELLAVRFAAGIFLVCLGALRLSCGFYGPAALPLVAVLLLSLGYLEMTSAAARLPNLRAAPAP
jgi:hypothetical protein